jgi:integrase
MYMAHVERRGRAEATIDFYMKKSTHLLRVLSADRDINELTRADIEAYVDARLRPVPVFDERGKQVQARVTLATVGKELVTLRAALNHLGKHRVNGKKMFGGDVTELIPEGVCGQYVPRERALSIGEFKRLHAQLPAERRDYLWTFVGLGVRDSELYRICPEHLDAKRGAVTIPGTKTDSSHRMLQPQPALFAMLQRRADGLAEGEPIFPEWANVRRDLHVACVKAKLKPVSPNDLRRTFASMQAEAGVPELVTASTLGHTNSSMVRRVYAKIGTESKRDALARLPQLVDPTVTLSVTDTIKKRGRSGQQVGHTSETTIEKPRKSRGLKVPVVPRDRIELPTRGFSIPPPRGVSSDNYLDIRPKLRLM